MDTEEDDKTGWRPERAERKAHRWVRKPSASAANFATKRQISKGDGGPANSNDL